MLYITVTSVSGSSSLKCMMYRGNRSVVGMESSMANSCIEIKWMGFVGRGEPIRSTFLSSAVHRAASGLKEVGLDRLRQRPTMTRVVVEQVSKEPSRSHV